MIYVKSKQIFYDMRQIYSHAVKRKFPNFGKEFDGLGPLFKQNGKFLKKYSNFNLICLGGKPLNIEEIAGCELLSNVEMLSKERMEPVPDLQKHLRTILQKLNDDSHAWPFKYFKKIFMHFNSILREPVDPIEVPEYHTYIEFPIDLGTMGGKFKEGYYTHVCLEINFKIK